MGTSEAQSDSSPSGQLPGGVDPLCPHAVVTTRTGIPIRTRWMIRADMPEVQRIERASFASADAWSEDDFIQCLRQRNQIGMVALDNRNEQVLGYFLYQLHKTRIQIVSLAVMPEVRRRGIASICVGRLVSKLSVNRRTRVVAEVRETNLPAQLFFRACGFKAVQVLRGKMDDPGEDAYKFVYRVRI
jgi:ribosomal-protein-alanine N-acetyltransferase